MRNFTKLPIVLGCLALTVSLWLTMSLTGWTQSSNLRLESRVDRLEAELSRVRSQLTQLESAVNRPSASTPVRPIESPDTVADLSFEEQFDNLAILAIELKQDLRQLEDRVTALERGTASDTF